MPGYFLFLLSCGIFSYPVFAQNQDRVDSLLSVLKKAGNDTNKVNDLRLLSYEYRNKDTALSRDYALQSYRLAKKLDFNKGMGWAYQRFASLKRKQDQEGAIRDYQMSIMYFSKALFDRGLMQSYLELAGLYRHMGKYDDAFDFYTKLKLLSEKIGDKKFIMEAIGGYANIYRYRDDYVNSLKYYLEGVKMAEEMGDKNAEASLLTNMAILYDYRKNHAEELRIRKKCLAIYEELHDSSNLILSYSNLGSSYYDMGIRDTALLYFNRSMEIIKHIGEDRASARYVSDAYADLGMVALDDKNYEVARVNYQKALDYMIKGKETKGTANAYGDLVFVYEKLGNWKEAEQCALRKEEIAEEIGYKRGMMEANSDLAEIYSHNKDFEKAFVYMSKYTVLRDSILNEKSTEQLADMQTKYQAEKKDQEIKLQNVQLENSGKEVEQRTRLIWLFAGVAILFLLMGFFVLRQYTQKKKANLLLEKHNIEIQIQAREISEQKEIIEAKNKDITDSIHYAKHIQEAILPPDDLVYEYLKECFVLYKPKDIVSGDFYWLNKNGDNVMFSVIDCTGHGVPGALMSVLAHSAINSVITQRPTINPAVMLNFIQDSVKETFKNQYNEAGVNDGMDIAMCSLDRSKMKLYYSAARIPLCLVRGTELIEIKGDKQTISGSTTETCMPFNIHEIDVQKGDNIYIFSDGYADQFGGVKGKKFKYNTLKQLLVSVALKPLYQQKQLLDKTIEDWRGELEQVDDILVIGVRV